MKIQDYFKNTYVVLGLIGIAFFLYKRNENNKLVKEEVKDIEEVEVEEETEIEEEKEIVKPVLKDKKQEVGDKFIEDVSEMKTPILKRTIETNKKMLKRAKMSVKKKEQIKSMLKYMQKEYDSRTRNK